MTFGCTTSSGTGYRIVATIAEGRVRLWSRNAIEWTDKVPELAKAVASLKLDSAQLDGEMIVPTAKEDGSDFNALQSRLSAESKVPLRYMLFDLPYLDGESLRALPLIERKARLEKALKKSRSKLLAYSAHQVGHGADLYAQALKAGWEGIGGRIPVFRCSKITPLDASGPSGGSLITTCLESAAENPLIGKPIPFGRANVWC